MELLNEITNKVDLPSRAQMMLKQGWPPHKGGVWEELSRFYSLEFGLRFIV